MTDNTNRNPEIVEMRELSLDEIDATAGAGLISWLRRIFGGDNPQPPRGPFQDKKM